MKYIKLFDTTANMNAAIANSTIGLLAMAENNGNPVVKIKKPSPVPTPTPVGPAPNEIWYTTSSNEPLHYEYNPEYDSVYAYDDDGGHNKLISDTYQNGKGVFVFEGNVTRINNDANLIPSGVSLNSIILPEGLLTIDSDTFNEITSEQFEVTIPSTITYIGYNAFAYLGNNGDILNIYALTPPTIDEYGFLYDTTCTIYVPSGSVNTYKTAWPDYAEYIFAMQ